MNKVSSVSAHARSCHGSRTLHRVT